MSARFGWIGAFFLLVGLANPLMGQMVEYSPEVGKPHFDFELPSIQDGKPIRLSNYRGKKVLLMHFASW